MLTTTEQILLAMGRINSRYDERYEGSWTTCWAGRAFVRASDLLARAHEADLDRAPRLVAAVLEQLDEAERQSAGWGIRDILYWRIRVIGRALARILAQG